MVPIAVALREVLLALPRGIGDAAVFVRPDARPLSLTDVQRAFRVAQRLSGVRPELMLYSIRHTFASWLAIEGQPLRTIQELLGHADVRMTLRYAHLSPSHLKNAVETIGAVEKANRQRAGNVQGENAEVGNAANPFGTNWRPQRESNPCRGLERAVS